MAVKRIPEPWSNKKLTKEGVRLAKVGELAIEVRGTTLIGLREWRCR